MKHLFIVAIGCLLFASCKEKGPAVDFHIKPEDTTYMDGVEAKQPRVVMIEEFTGVTCAPCPSAHDKLHAMEKQHGERVAIVGIQVFDFLLANPVIKDGDTLTRHDNRTDDGTKLRKYLGGVFNTPTAAIDRVPINTKMITDAVYWADGVNDRMAVKNPANLHMTSSYDAAKREAVITVKVAYTEAVTGQQLLNVYLREDSIVDAQLVGLEGVNTNYLHMHTLRDMLTPPEGTTILNDVEITPGRVYEQTFKYTVNAAWKPEHCVIVANVSKSVPGGGTTDKEVLQAAQIHLK